MRHMTSRWTTGFIGRLARILILALCLPRPAAAHDFSVTPVSLVVDRAGIRVTLYLHQADLQAAVLEDPSGREEFTDVSEIRRHADRIRDYVEARVRLTADGAPIPLRADKDWPPAELALTRADSAGRAIPAFLPLVLEGPLPERAVSLGMTWLLYGESEFVPLFDVTIRDPAGAAARSEYLKVNQRVEIDLAPFRGHVAAVKSLPRVFADFVVLGYTHILPLGLDHILFVLGLFLLGGGWRSLLKQVTAFTIAHSLTLALAMLGIVRLPSRIVEPIIALSIAYVAVENLFRHEVNRWRWLVVFGFGLVHGLGFAGVLEELGLPAGRFLPALIGFNFGVEGGQLSVLALAALATWPLRGKSWYRAWVARPVCVAIAGVGLFWAVQRALG